MAQFSLNCDGELHKVARHLRSRKRRIRRIRKHPVKRVSKLVEHRTHIGEADQRRLPGAGFAKFATL